MKKLYILFAFAFCFIHEIHAQDRYWGVGGHWLIPTGELAIESYDLGALVKGSILQSVGDKFYIGGAAGYAWHLSNDTDDFFTFPVTGRVVYSLTEKFMLVGDGGYAFGTSGFENSVFLDPGLAFQFKNGTMIEANYQTYIQSKSEVNFNSIAVGGTYYFSF